MSVEYTIETRRDKILELLHQNGKVKVSDLSELFSISEVTIRNDLTDLESEGLLDRVHGGAISSNRLYRNLSYNERTSKNTEQKKKIAKEVASHIKDGETIMINSGTTTHFIAKELINLRNINIVTNSITIAMELANRPNINLILLGGNVNADYSFTFGDDAIAQLERYKADKLILSVDGVSSENGISTYHYLESRLNQIMIERANNTYVVADSSKIGKESFSFIASINKVSYLITDETENTKNIASIIKSGVDVITC